MLIWIRSLLYKLKVQKAAIQMLEARFLDRLISAFGCVHVYLHGSTPSSTCRGAEPGPMHHMSFNIKYSILRSANSSAETDSLCYFSCRDETFLARRPLGFCLSIWSHKLLACLFFGFKAAEYRAFIVVWSESQVDAPPLVS
jgi:hypothetical protein